MLNIIKNVRSRKSLGRCNRWWARGYWDYYNNLAFHLVFNLYRLYSLCLISISYPAYINLFLLHINCVWSVFGKIRFNGEATSSIAVMCIACSIE